MNFIKPAKNKSAYMIEGYDMDWIYTDAHSASFTNLPAGSYSLLIKAANNDAVWNDKPHVLTITVLPPPWKSWWAYTLYGVFGGLLILWAIYFFASRAALRRKIQYEKMVNAKQEELHRMKMDFFTHISHEIRTPLTLIMGPVEMLLRILPAGSQGQKLLLTVKSNAERLLKLTTDLLDFRKADSGYTQLTIRAADIVAFTRSVYDKFTGAAAKKSIEHSFDCKEESIEVYFDPHHLEIVLSNLLSNAIKFTPDKGRIWVHIARKNNETVEITVGDNGIGIPKESEDKIFSNYYQANAGGIKNLGSGIGLAFSKSLVELHKGKLNFQSDINPETGRQETRFIVTLQLGKDHFTGNHLITN
jgi:signal transduction histidine kinase